MAYFHFFEQMRYALLCIQLHELLYLLVYRENVF